MKILSINSGSSSLKFMIFNYNTRETLASGGVERVGLPGSVLEFSCKKHTKVTVQHDCPDHTEAVRVALESMINPEYGILESMDEIKAVGHRVLHGGDKIKQSVIVDDHIIEVFKSLFDLGPLHMPPNIMGIEAARKVLPKVPHMAIMDTAWHQSMPDYAYMYALPYEWYEKYGIRRYGFHGTSHLYVSKRTAVLLGKAPKDTNAIILHIGNGASACAIKNGHCVDTTMGLTPLEGLIMGTRAGDFDCAINYFMMNKKGFTPDQMNDIANKKSGHLGITGKYSDRAISKKACVKVTTAAVWP
jgi:acetate kinase